ncbi:MAG TPA: aldehyde dehydrogenase family protein, partial [Acidobacteriota bacterium]
MIGHWINGKYTNSSSGQIFPVVNPATEEVIDLVARGNAEDADRAVMAAYKAFPEWKNMPGLEKAERMHQFAQRLRKGNRKIAELLTHEGGKPLI